MKGNPPRLESSRVLFHRRLTPGYGRLGLSAHAGYAAAQPGQFVMLRLPGGAGTPLLRRPFSIHRLIAGDGAGSGIEILYKVVGAFTGQLAGLRQGAALDLLGPLGRGFRVPQACRRIFLAAGGVGAAPLFFLAQRLAARREGAPRLSVFLGGRSRRDLLCARDFSALGAEVLRTTDDGSAGARCRLTDPLAQALERQPPDLICACGPPEMLRCVAGLAEAAGIPCQLSLESVMACGIGACLGCAVAGRGGPEAPYRHVCIEGPVFDRRDLGAAF
jgi:dihydroorotate dehydrogenase electron transfer subunit